MTAALINGRDAANQINTETAKGVVALKERGIIPGLAVVLVGENPASQVYVKNKHLACEKVGIKSFDFTLPVTVTENDLLKKIAELNADKSVHGILVQLPLPKHIDEQKILYAIDPAKDVDGFHPINVGKFNIGDKTALVPCTPQGCLYLIHQAKKDLSGLNAVVIGRSNIVGKPMAQLLLQANCTVTIAHSQTKDLATVTKTADILVVAVGRAEMIKAEHIKKGAIVVDVGMNRVDKGLVGDVDFASAKTVASAITPVPGGVGPMTIAYLLQNTVKAAQ